MFFIIGCDNKEHEPLYKVMEKLENSWTDEQIRGFKKSQYYNKSNADFESNLNIISKELNNQKDSTLLKYFYSKDIRQQNHMFSIVLNTLHNKLNNEPLNIEKQFKDIYTIEKDNYLSENENKKRAVKYYKKYMVGDTIFIRMPIRNNSAFEYGRHKDNNWIYNDNYDLLVKGLILEKKDYKFYGKVFHVKVLTMNKENVKILYQTVKENEEITVNLERNIIESNDIK